MPEIGKLKMTQEVLGIIGEAGGDGGYYVITPNGLKKVPDNNPEGRAAYQAIVENYAKLQKIVLKQRAEQQLSHREAVQ